MKNGSMFNNIKSYTEQDFADKHPYVYIYLPDGTVSRYKVVAAQMCIRDSFSISSYIIGCCCKNWTFIIPRII